MSGRRAPFFKWVRPLSAISSGQISEAATRYASALIDLASELGDISSVETELDTIGAAIGEVPELSYLLNAPGVKTEEKVKAVSAVTAKLGLSNLVSNFIGVVAQNRRAAELGGIIAAFKNLSAERRGLVQAHVTTAHELNDEQMGELNTFVRQMAGGDVSMEIKVDPDLIAGFQLRVGSRLIDASVKSKLDRMNLAMKGA